MKRMVATLATLLGAAMLAGCGSGGGTEGSTEEVSTITFSTWQAEEPGYKEFWSAAKSKFEADHPGVTLEIQQTAFKDYQQTITTQLAANQAPDVMQLPSRFFPAFADKDFLASLQTEIEGTDIEANWPEAQQLMKWNDEYQGVLMQSYGYVMYYNEQMLADAGVAVPTTWEEFQAAAATLTTGETFGVAMDTKQDPNIILELSWPATGAGIPYIKDGAYNVTSPEMVALADQVRELSKLAPQGIASEQKRQYFVDGKAAMMFDGPFVVSLLDEAPEEIRSQFKVAPMPFATSPGALSSSMHMPATAEGAKKELGWDFIEMLTTAEMQDLFVTEVGSPAPRNGAGADQLADNPRLEVFTQVAGTSVDVVPDEAAIRLDYATFTDAVGNAVSELMSTDRPSAEIMADLQSTLESKLPLE
ncbi:MAG: ABC transporter substrate-binding protein [Propioniciclava sp.]